MTRIRNFSRYAWGVLYYNLLVILWGAYVRATGSGAGCGEHWPLCNGQVIPRAPEIKTIIEFSHRLTSGLALLAVAGLVVLAYRAFPRAHRIRKLALLSFALIIVEALIGAGLVVLGLVAENSSLTRAASMILHLTNTFFLLAALSITALRATEELGPSAGAERSCGPSLRWKATFAAGFALTLSVGITGAIAALGDTLFPSTTLMQGLQQDFAEASHIFLKLRVLHPLIAVLTGAYLILLARALQKAGADGRALRASRWLIGAVLAQLSAGFINVALLAPIWLQLVHLLLADGVWILLVLMVAARSERPG